MALSIEERLAAVEDRLAICDLIARHALAVDTGNGAAATALLPPDGTFDRGAPFALLAGAAHAGAAVATLEHRLAIEGGLAHLHGVNKRRNGTPSSSRKATKRLCQNGCATVSDRASTCFRGVATPSLE
jgi:hypothetical protein